MANVPLTFACGLYDRVIPLFKGEVQPKGIDLKFIVNDVPRNIFDRMGATQEFDAAEFSCSEYISRIGANQNPFVAIPVFTSRVFRHSFLFTHRRTGIKTPHDLNGKRVGIPLYTMSAAIWIRAFLKEDYGVDLSSIQWVEGALKAAGPHGSPSAMPLLKPARIEINNSGKSLSQLLSGGAVDAIISSRTVEGFETDPDIYRLVPNYRDVEKDYYRRTKIFPIMHFVVIRRDIYEKHPFVAQSLYDALCESKNRSLALMRELGALRYMLPWLTADIDEIDELFDGDPWPYGVEANRPTLEALLAYMIDQDFIPDTVRLDDLFVKVEGGP